LKTSYRPWLIAAFASQCHFNKVNLIAGIGGLMPIKTEPLSPLQREPKA
jgi:hypothetical protein